MTTIQASTRRSILALAIAASLLAGCGDASTETEAGTDGSTSIPAISTTEATPDKTTTTAIEEDDGFVVDLAGDLDTQLFGALQADDIAAIQELVAAGADLEATSRGGLTPFQLAVKGQKPEVAVALIDLGANVLAPSPVGQQPTFYDALGFGYVDVVDAMIEAGADVQQVEASTMITPMMRAVESGNLELIRSIADLGGDLSSTDVFGDGLYSWVFFFDLDLEVAELLHELGVDPTITNNDGVSVLEDAERRASPEVLEFIISIQP